MGLVLGSGDPKLADRLSQRSFDREPMRGVAITMTLQTLARAEAIAAPAGRPPQAPGPAGMPSRRASSLRSLISCSTSSEAGGRCCLAR